MTDWQRVLAANGKGVKIRDGNRVDYLVDGQATYQAMHDAIKTAFRKDAGCYIYLLAWWFDDDFALVERDPQSTMSALLGRASEEFGVQVRVMLWLNRLAALWPFDPAVQTRQYKEINNLRSGGCVLDNTLVNVYRAQHQKVLIVKGTQGLIGFCGGLDIALDRVKPVTFHTGSPFHDVHCRIEGDAVCDLVDVFVQRWSAHPETRSIDKQKGELKGLIDRRPPGNRQPIGTQSVGIARTFNAARMDVAPNRPNAWCAEELSVWPMIAAAIQAARNFIYIEDQYLVSMETAEAIAGVLGRLQHVTILIPEVTDLPYNEPARAKFVYRLWKDKSQAAKVRVLHRPKGQHSYIHSKVWIIDDELAVIGSANCNRRGWAGDSEVAAAIFDKPGSVTDPSFAQQFRMHLWSEHLGIDKDSLRDGTDPTPWINATKNGKVRLYNPFLEASQKDAERFPDPNETVNIKTRLIADATGYKGPMTVKAVWDTIYDPPAAPAPSCPGNEMRRPR